MRNPPNLFDLFFRNPVKTLPSEGPGTGPDVQRPADAIEVPRRAAEWLGPQRPPPIDPTLADAIEREIFRAQRLAAPGPAPVPQYSVLYNSLGTRDTWHYSIDCCVTGTITPAAAATAAVTIPATMLSSALAPLAKLSRFPGAILMYLVIKSFHLAPVAQTMTGAYDVRFLTEMGDTVPLCVLPGPGSYNEDVLKALPSPFTDAGLSGGRLGTLSLTGNTIAGAVVCVWDMAFAFAYKIPVLQEYEGGGGEE